MCIVVFEQRDSPTAFEMLDKGGGDTLYFNKMLCSHLLSFTEHMSYIIYIYEYQ